MIKLVSQFDNENSKLSLATPTCGSCCCCCCCCLVTTIVTISISSRNFGRYLANEDYSKSKLKSNKLVALKIIFRFIGYILYVLLSAYIMFCILVLALNGGSAPWHEGTDSIDYNFGNFVISLSMLDFLFFAGIMIVISIILLKRRKVNYSDDDINKKEDNQIVGDK